MPIYMFVKGQVQGIIPGQSTASNYKNYWDVLTFADQLTSPRDPASGLPTGRRQWHPITVTIPFGSRVTQLFSALANNENLPTVIIRFTDNLNAVKATITLTNASIGDISQVGAAGPPTTQMSLYFEHIDYSAGSVFADDWSAPST